MSAHTRLESLYRAHAGPVKAYALRGTTPATADDVAADTLLVGWRRLEDVPEPALWWHHSANTNLVAYRTSDGGAHRLGTAIALPAR